MADEAGGQPSVLVHKLKPLDPAKAATTPPIDYDAVSTEDVARAQQGLPPRYAIAHPVKITPETHGQWEAVDKGTLVWRLAVTSPNAKSINLGFTRYWMPRGGRLFVYSADLKSVVRPFTAADNEQHGQLWTPAVPSNEIVVEVTVSPRARKQLDIVLGSINTGYRGFGTPSADKSGSCNVDVICPEGDNWRDEIPSVGVISTGGSTFCTGFMVNNVRQDLTPYFMTANHCSVGSGNAASLVVYWNYENSYCRTPGSPESGAPGDGTLDEFNTGSIFRASYSPSDFTLVELDDEPNPDFMITYSGWDATGADATSAVGIHHPNTDEKRISFEDQPTTTTSYLGTSVPGDGTHVRIEDWDLGTTEPGSSGSPVYNQDHRVIGQLHGGYAACGNNDSDWYGKFSVSWDGGGSSSSRLSDWLDPDATGTLIVDTITGAGLQVSPAGDVLHIGEVGGPFTDPTITYSLDNPSPDPVDYSVSLGAGTAALTIDGGTSPVTGTLTALGGHATVDVSLDSPETLSAGIYTREVLFEDLTNDRTTTITHTIEVGQTGFTTTPEYGFQSGGPLGGPFPGTITYTIASTRPTPVDVTVSASDDWISINGSINPVTITLTGTGDNAPVEVGFSTAAEALSAGLYYGTVTFTNDQGGAGDTVRDISLDVGRLVYAATTVPQAISDNSTITSKLGVPDAYCVGDVDVDIDITHTYIGDLIVELESPAGTVVRLHDRSGGSDEDIVTRYDDDGDGTPPDGPGVLADFDFAGSAGIWTLTVSDNAGGDTGTLNAWSLRIAIAGDTCPPIARDVEAAVPDSVASDITLDAESVEGNPLVHIITSLPAHGDLSDPQGGPITSVPYTLMNSGDTVTYDPVDGYMGTDAFTYKANDGQDSAEADVNIEVGGPLLIYAYTLDSNPGWDTTGEWGFGQPNGQDGDPSSGVTGSNVYGYNLHGDYPNNMSEEYLTSGPIDCSILTAVEVRFWRWLGVEHSSYDHATFLVSNNGTTWSELWHNPSGYGNTINEAAWSQHIFDISAVADEQATVYLRWVMGPTDGSVTYHGWSVDDIEIWGIQGAVDCDGNGVPDDEDIAAGTHEDCQPNGVPDVCDVDSGTSADCQPNGVPDECDISGGASLDVNLNGVPDECDLPCADDSDCDDDDVCTWDQCVLDACVITPNTYGDVDHNGAMNLFDVFCILDGIGGDFSTCSLEDDDINPCEPDGVLNLLDTFAVLDAIGGVDPCCSP
jgi:subtilisin-like proprotein convertase family protein